MHVSFTTRDAELPALLKLREERIVELERQRDDLHVALNTLLERARAAEASVKRYRENEAAAIRIFNRGT